MPVELTWDGKYDVDGKRKAPLKIALPFPVETVNESVQECRIVRTSFSRLELKPSILITNIMNGNILQYESKIWHTADLLRGVGIKESDFPKFMMPFFALIMVESRLIRAADEIRDDFSENEIEEFLDEIRDLNQGYNDYILRNNKSLADICKNDKMFETDFDFYLKAFDSETKNLLGVNKGEAEEKFLNISGIAGQLKKKRILFAFAQAWAEIDLKPFNNSEITTLEEHIKRRWADISAETAGEQYTPDDIIALVAEIVSTKIKDTGKIVTIYDPTSGGGNLLFGVEDRLSEKSKLLTATFGQDWNDALYALAKIESRFRKDSTIRYGNSLTDTYFSHQTFDVVVANPPYGVDWKGYWDDILRDELGRFKALPSVSDGQLLFTQHIVSQLDDSGISVVVHNGSTLFSGDAGSGESEIRKYFFDNDYVEAIIQLPTDEFFNTNIYTYLWVFNKNKSPERRNKIILINASEKFDLLKKNKGKKRKTISEFGRQEIIEALEKFTDNDFARVFDKWFFYYNKQAIMLTNLDENGKTLESILPISVDRYGEEKREPSIKLAPVEIRQDEIGNNDFEIKDFDKEKYSDLNAYFAVEILETIKALDYKEKNLTVITTDAKYFFDADKETIVKESGRMREELGCGKIVVKAAIKKASRTQPAKIVITAELTPDYQKDYEIIPYSPNEEENRQNIADFMAKYITKPFVYQENTIGVEINFNKVFYQPEVLRPLPEIAEDLREIEKHLKSLEAALGI
jgi:type I restriction enzyme M protein